MSYAIKYADDAAMVGLISNDDETLYTSDIERFVNCCDDDGLNLNVGKTKEMVIDLRKGEHEHEPVKIKGEDVAMVSSYIYLGTTLASDLSWTSNVDRVVSKATKRLYHLRKLREFQVDSKIIELFYHSIVESVAVFGIAVWGGNMAKKDRKKIEKVRRRACKIIGKSLGSWESVYSNRVKGLGARILKDIEHPLNPCFRLLPSSRRIQQIKAKRTRFANSFVAQAIRMLNE